MSVGKNMTWKKAKQYHLPYNIKAVGKNIKMGKGMEILGKKIKIFKNGGGEEYQVVRDFYTPFIFFNKKRNITPLYSAVRK